MRPMVPRDIDEAHRVGSALELFFDLCFVVAVAVAGASLHGALLADPGRADCPVDARRGLPHRRPPHRQADRWVAARLCRWQNWISVSMIG